MRGELIKVAVIGAGGHAKVVIDLLRRGDFDVVASVDPTSDKRQVNGVPVFGGEESSVLDDLLRSGVHHAFVALGDNGLRERVARRLEGLGFRFVNAIGRSAVISPSAVVGTGCAIMEGSIVNADATIGDFAIMNTNSSLDHDCIVERCVHLAPGVAVAGTVRLGERVFLGAGARVIPGVTICKDTVVGAGAVVISNIAAPGVWAGVPARQIRVRT